MFSVVIPFYNMQKYLPEALTSVFQQKLKNIEIIIINDGSTEPEALKLLDKIAKTQKQIKIITQQNKGLAAARNAGVRAAKSEYICCLDADDQILPEYLLAAQGIFEADKNNEVGMVTSDVQRFGDNSNIWKIRKFNPTMLALENTLQSATTFRRSAWKKVDGYDESMREGYEDWDFWIRMVTAGYSWQKISGKPQIRYRVRDDSMVIGSDAKKPHLYSYIISKNQEFFRSQAADIYNVFLSFPGYKDKIKVLRKVGIITPTLEIKQQVKRFLVNLF